MQKLRQAVSGFQLSSTRLLSHKSVSIHPKNSVWIVIFPNLNCILVRWILLKSKLDCLISRSDKLQCSSNRWFGDTWRTSKLYSTPRTRFDNSPFRGPQQQLSSCASFHQSHENCFLEYRHTHRYLQKLMKTAGVCQPCGAAAGLAETSSSLNSLLVSSSRAAPGGQQPFESRGNFAIAKIAIHNSFEKLSWTKKLMQRMFQKLVWVQYSSSGMQRKVLFPFYNLRYKAMTDPKLTDSKSRIHCWASDGYRLEPMWPQRLVPAAASPDGAAEARLASRGRAVMALASPSVSGESLLRHPEPLA